MKNCGFYLSLITLVISVITITGVAEESPLSISGDFTYGSRYYWRGLDAEWIGGQVMPSIDLSYTIGAINVGLNLWYAQGFEQNEETDASELDYTIYASVTAGPVDVSLGVIDYLVPIGVPFKEGHVFEVNAGISVNTLPIDNSLTIYANVIGDDDKSIYVAPSFGYSFKNLNFGLAIGLVLNKSAAYGTEDLALVDLTPSISYDVPFGDSQTSISFNLGYNPNSGLKSPYFAIGTGF